MDFYTLSKIVMSAALLEPLLLYVACWPSARNLMITHYLPISIFPLVGGVFFFFDFRIGLLAGNEPYLASLLIVLAVGAVAHALAFYLGFSLNTPIKVALFRLMGAIRNVGIGAPDRLVRFVTLLAILSAALQIYAYAKMGFTPLTAADPLAAKFYAGTYAESYAPVAPFLRLGFQIYVAIAPLFMVCFPKSFGKKVGYLLIITIAAATIFVSLKRGPIAVPFLDFFLAISVFYKRGKFSLVGLGLYVAIFAFGAAANGILYYAIGLKSEIDFEAIFAGVPDISDLLWFWSGFQTRDFDLSFGRTILGGIIPFHYDWNPAVVTKLAIGASPDAPTGGFRLPDAVWGYISFGYVGAVLFPAFTGAMSGIQMSLLRRLTERRDLTFFQFYMMYFVMMAVMGFAGSLLQITLDLLTAAFFTYVLIILLVGRPRKQSRVVPTMT